MDKYKEYFSVTYLCVRCGTKASLSLAVEYVETTSKHNGEAMLTVALKIAIKHFITFVKHEFKEGRIGDFVTESGNVRLTNPDPNRSVKKKTRSAAARRRLGEK